MQEVEGGQVKAVDPESGSKFAYQNVLWDLELLWYSTEIPGFHETTWRCQQLHVKINSQIFGNFR